MPTVDALLRVAAAALSVPARLAVVDVEGIEAMVAAKSAAVAQLGRLSKRALVTEDRVLLADIPRTTDRDGSDARSFAGWPLTCPGSTALGVLTATTETPGPLRGNDLAVLADTALAAAEALANRRDLIAATAEAASFRTLLDMSHSIIGRCLPDGTPLFISAAIQSVLGFDAAELVAEGRITEAHPDDQDAMRTDWQTVAAGGTSLRQVRVRHSDGSWRTLRVSARPVRDAAGEVYEVRFSARDITDELAIAQAHATAQADAAHRQALLDTILETIEVGVVASDADGNRIVVNQVARTMLDTLPPDGVTRRWVDWPAFEADGVTPTNVPTSPVDLALRGEATDGVVLAMPHRDGPPRLVRCHARQMRGHDGDVIGAVAIFADVTEIARTSEALREARDRAESIITTVIDGFISLDVHGVVQEWNPAAEQITGWTQDEAIGQPIASLLARPEARDRVASMLATGEAHAEPGGALTRHLLRKDGTPLTVELSTWKSTHRGEVRYNAFIRDVTEAHADAAAIAAAHGEFTAALEAMPRDLTLMNVVRDDSGEPCRLVYRWSNRHMLEGLKLQMADLAGRYIDEMWPSLVECGWHDLFLAAARTGQPIQRTDEWLGGELVSGAFDLVITPLDRDTILVESTDTTERLLAKQELERSERILSVTNHAAGIGSSSVDLQTGKWTWSEQTFEVFGLNGETAAVPDNATFRNQIVHPDDVDIYDRQWTDILAGNPRTSEFRIRRPDGEVRHLLQWSDVDLDSQGAVVGVVLGVQDQTERREREIALARSRELEGLVVDRSPIGIAFLDEEGRYMQVNSALCHMLGRSRDELLASNFLDITHPEERADGLRRHRDLVAGTLGSYAQDKRYVHANGRILWVSVHKTVLQSSDRDQPVRVLSQIIDISERQEQTDELTRQASTDALTGLANRRSWEPRLHAALAEALATGKSLAVAILDLDKFKNFNDTFGHPVGDQLLSETSHAWRTHLIREAPSALLARLGGEEFGVLLPDTGLEDARSLLEAMIVGVTRNQTASAGFTLGCSTDDARTVMTRADNALYTAKNAGRARVVAELP